MYRVNLISDSIAFLKEDFFKVSINPIGIIHNIFNIILILSLFLLLYSIGRMVNRRLFGNIFKDLNLFINFALGYITAASSIFFLGFIGLLYPQAVIALILVFAVIVFLDIKAYPFDITFKMGLFKFELVSFLSLLVLSIGFLRLFGSQTAGDPLDYHLGFPRIYLENHSMMIPNKGNESYITIPQLPEMLYIPSEIVSRGELSRIIHFSFFVLTYLLICKISVFKIDNKNVRLLTGFIFISAPIILKISTAAFSDLPSIFCLLLSMFILTKDKITYRSLILSGLIIGGSLAGKIWTLYYLPFFVLFLILQTKRDGFIKITKNIAIFLISTLIIVAPWFLRSYLISGNPFYVNDQLGQGDITLPVRAILTPAFSLRNISFIGIFNDYGPVYFFGIIVALLCVVNILKKISLQFKHLLIIMLLASLIFPWSISTGRYTIPYATVFMMVIASGYDLVLNNKFGKIIFISVSLAMIGYYAFTTLIILPYAFGWADTNSYIKRNLIKDTSAYFDFNGKFENSITPNETILTFGMSEFYYADFRYNNIYYYFNKSNSSFNFPLSKIHKLLIRGGDYQWLCDTLKFSNCNDYKVLLLVKDDAAKMYLYNINYTKYESGN